MQLLGFALAAAIGLSLGILGGGGSILTVPAFVYVLGIDPKPAIAMSLVVVGATSLVGAVSHWRSGNVRLHTAIVFGFVAMVGSYAGARAATFIPATVQLATLGVVMLAASVLMLKPLKPGPANGVHIPMSPRLLAAALAVGALTGIVGIGGGFLIVPALVLLAGVPMKEAVGTSLLVIAMNSASGFAGYLGTVEIRWSFVAAFTAVAVAGILAGSYLVRFISAPALKRAFAVFLLFIGAFVLFQNRAVFSF